MMIRIPNDYCAPSGWEHLARNVLFTIFWFVFFLGNASYGASNTLAPTESGFPARPIRILVPTSPGGLIDFTARKFAEIATKKTNTPFVVINKPGGGGVVAFEETLRAPSDGYTLQAATRSNVAKLVAAGRSDLLRSAYWSAKMLDDPQCVIVNLESPIKDWSAVVENARQLEGRQLWLGPDIGGLDHVSAAHIWEAAGIQARWIPYESGGQAIAALLGGMGATYTGNPSEIRGRPALAIAAICAAERLPQFPDAPTFGELGVPGLETESMWRGFVLHPSTPADILAWYDKLFQEVTQDPAWRSEWEIDGIRIAYETEPAFRALVEEEIQKFTDFLHHLGMEADGRSSGPKTAPSLVHGLIGCSLLGCVVWVILMLRSSWRIWLWSAAQWAVMAGWLLIGIFAWMAGFLPAGSAVDPIGAAGVPLLWCLLLLPCMGVIAWEVHGEERKNTTPAHPAHPAQAGSPSDGLAATFLGALVCSVLLMPWIGYYLAIALALPVLLLLLKWHHPLRIALLVIAWLLFVYVVFQRLLHVDLPLGRLF